MILKGEKGFALTDVTVAIVIIVLFTGLIVSISYNIYMQSNFIKRNDTATNYIVNLFEYAKTLDFEDIDFENLSLHFVDITVIDKEDDNGNVYNGYTMVIEIIETNSGFSKQINAEVRYKLGEKTNKINMTTVINK